MNRLFIFLVFLIGMTGQVYASYGELKKEFESYSPPLIIQDNVSPVVLESAKSLPDQSGITQKLRQIEAKWKNLLNLRRGESIAWPLDKNLLDKYASLGKDDKAAALAVRDRFSLELADVLALIRNPGIKAAENRFRAALESLSQVTELDEILRQYNAYTEIVMPGVGPMKGKDPIDKRFPFPGIFSLKAQIVLEDVKAAAASLDIARRDVVTGTHKAYWELLFARNAQVTIQRTIGFLRDLEGVATIKYQAGNTSFQDVLKIQINRKTLEEDLVSLHEKQINLEFKIRDLLHLKNDAKIGVPDKRRPNHHLPGFDKLNQIALDNRQELVRMRARIAKTDRMIELAETMILPNYSQNLALFSDETALMVGTQASKSTFPTTISASTGAGLPKNAWYGSQDAFLRQTRQMLNAQKAKLESMEAGTTTMIHTSWFVWDKAFRESNLYEKTVVKLSRAAMEVSTREYESGNISFADVIGSYTLWLNASLALERKHADMGVAWAELERTAGTPLIDRKL